MSDSIRLSEEGRQTMKNAIQEMVNSFYREQAEKDLRKEIAKRMLDELEFPTKLFNKAAKTAYNDSARRQNDELTEMLDLLEECGFYTHNLAEELS